MNISKKLLFLICMMFNFLAMPRDAQEVLKDTKNVLASPGKFEISEVKKLIEELQYIIKEKKGPTFWQRYPSCTFGFGCIIGSLICLSAIYKFVLPELRVFG